MTIIDVTNEPLPSLPPRKADSHKGDFGRALLVGGSRGMTGAITLAGMATLRGGAGLVTLAVPESCLEIVAGYEPSYMTVPLVCDEVGCISADAEDTITRLAHDATAIGIGPGLGRSEQLTSLVGRLYHNIRKPMVVDADGLNALAATPNVLGRPGGPRILTPHPGEFARLVGEKIDDPGRRRERAIQLAADCGVTIILKGYRTLITDGAQSATNTTGNPGLATGGTGDVLTGITTAMLCQGLAPFPAARLGAHLHGLAGDLAAAELGQVSMIASDLLDFLPHAFRQIAS